MGYTSEPYTPTNHLMGKLENYLGSSVSTGGKKFWAFPCLHCERSFPCQSEYDNHQGMHTGNCQAEVQKSKSQLKDLGWDQNPMGQLDQVDSKIKNMG